MVTIVVVIILATVSINAVLRENGILWSAERAENEYNKAEATEIMNLKITNIQISSYAENKELPTLQYLADGLCEDEEVEYVLLESQATASLDKIRVGENTSIFTKLKQYPYEFEINSSLQLASIDGVKIATSNSQDYQELKDELELLKKQVQEQQTKIDSLEASLVTKDISSSLQLNSTYVTQRGCVKLTKSGNTIHLVAYLNIVADIPSQSTLITIESPYAPKVNFVGIAHANNGGIVSYLEVKADGTLNISKAIDASSSATPTIQIDLVWQI